MSTTAEPRTYTPEDLLAMPDRKNYELVDGNLVELNVSTLSSWVASELNALLRNHCRDHAPAWIFGADCGCQCFPGHPRKVRKPDISLVRRERLAAEQLDEGFLTIPPDLVVEVVSPNDLAYEVMAKVKEYLGAGVRLVWVVYPPTRFVQIHRGDGSAAIVHDGDELDGEDVVPGFRCPVDALFPPSTPVAPSA
jgi:Uma2 family endonuclease